jgi:hypothetical protein
LSTAWFTGADLEREVAEQDIARYYSALSWHCMRAGTEIFRTTAAFARRRRHPLVRPRRGRSLHRRMRDELPAARTGTGMLKAAA